MRCYGWVKVYMAALIEPIGPANLVGCPKQGIEGGMGERGCLFVDVYALSGARCLAR